MTKANSADYVVAQLEHALAAQNLSAEVRQSGETLLSRLRSPVEVVLLGRSSAGKSRLVNMLVGESVVPEGADLPVLEVAGGPQARTIHVMEDGTRHPLDGVQLHKPTAPGTVLVRVELPVPLLGKLTLTEVRLAGSPADQRAAADWAIGRADIVLWCTQTFDQSERELWENAPEALKDHSFLVLTKSDQLMMRGELSNRIARLENIVAEEFYSLFPVATIQAITARGPKGSLDKELWNTSGGRALVETVLRLIETGRNADTDSALMFLSRHGAPLTHPNPGPQADEAATPPVAQPTEPPVEPSAEPPAEPDRPTSGAPSRERDQAANPPPQPGPDQNTGPEETAKTRNARVFAQALEFLHTQASTMLTSLAKFKSDDQNVVLDHCLDAANTLAEIMMEAEASDISVFAFQNDVLESADMMLLFQLEKTENAAADAVTLLLQLKKELAEKAVA